MTKPTPPRASVIIRNFNRVRCVTRAIDSALAQTHQDLEVVVVDDASTDGSGELIREQFGQDSRVRLIELEGNVGAGEAANVGIRAARGQLIGFLDSDDEWLPECLAAHTEVLSENPTAGISFCDYVEVWEPYDFERIIFERLPANQRKAMLLGGFIHTMTLTVFKREILDFVPQLDARYKISHDYFFWLNLALELEQPFVHVPKALVRHYRSFDGVTTRHQDWLDEYRHAVARGFEHPYARFYATEQETAFKNISLGIYAREQTGQRLASTSGQSVSVVVRARYSTKTLERALRSVRVQSLQAHDITVVYDPEVPGIGAWLETQPEDLQCIPCGPSFGPGSAINLGTAAAQGDLLAFLDDNAQWSEDYLATQLRANSYAVGNPSFTVSDYTVVSVNGEHNIRNGINGVPSQNDLIRHLLQHPPEILSNLVCRRDRLLAAEGVHDGLVTATALDLVLRLLARTDNGDARPTFVSKPPARIPRPLVSVHEGEYAPPSPSAEAAANLAVILEYHTRTGAQHLRLVRNRLYDDLCVLARHSTLA